MVLEIIPEITIDGQKIHAHDSITFDYHHIERYGRVVEIRNTENGPNILCETIYGYRQFYMNEMTNINVKSIWGLIRKIIAHKH